jgi:hypothetical protein
MYSNVRQAQRAWISDQFAEHAASSRQGADLASGLLVYPGVDEALEPALVLVQDSDGGVPRAGQVAGSIEHAAQDGLRIELGDDRSTHLEKLLESLVRERSFVQGPDRRSRFANPRLSRGIARRNQELRLETISLPHAGQGRDSIGPRHPRPNLLALRLD